MRLDKRAKHIRNEFEAKYKALQIKVDGYEVRYLQMKEDFAESEAKVVEHAEYERVIHELGGKTITEVEAEALQAVRGAVREQKYRGPDSWEVADHVVELRYLTNLFPLIISQQPIIKEWLDAYPQVQPAKKNVPRFRSLSPTVPSRLLRDRIDMLSFPAQIRLPPAIPKRGDGNRTTPQPTPRGQRSRDTSTSSRGGGCSRGRGGDQDRKKKDDINIDDVLNPRGGALAKYFYCSRGSDGGGPSS